MFWSMPALIPSGVEWEGSADISNYTVSVTYVQGFASEPVFQLHCLEDK